MAQRQGGRSAQAAEPAYDLHMHSTYSDGSCSVEQLIERARAQGLQGIAITDHDSLKQLAMVRHIARANDYPVLAGLEASTINPVTGRKVHILAYGLEATPDGSGPLEKIVDETLRLRTANTLWQTWTLVRAGVSFEGRVLSLDRVVAQAGESTAVYKQHVMEVLLGTPNADPEHQRIYRSLFKGDGIANHDINYPEALDVVRAIREQGGHPVLAHPGQMDSWDLVPDLVKAGLEGIEVHHPDHKRADVERARELADRFGLIRTGGSDFHGRYGTPESVGCCRVSAEEAGERVAELFEAESTLR